MKKYLYFGSFAVVIAAILWSLDGLLRRQLFNLPGTVIVFWEHIIGLIVLSPILLHQWRTFRVLTKKQWLSILFVAFLSGAVGTIFYTKALLSIQFIPFSVVVLLQQLQPLFAILTAAVLLKERISKRFILLAALALVAAYGVSFPNLTVNFETGSGTITAALLALGAAVCWGASTAFSKYTLKGTSFLTVTGARFALTPVFALIFTATFQQTKQLTALTTTQWWYIIAITFSTGLVALAIYYFGLQKIPASRATLLELAWPVSAVLTGFFLLNENLTLTQWLASFILIATMYAVARDAQGNQPRFV